MDSLEIYYKEKGPEKLIRFQTNSGNTEVDKKKFKIRRVVV